MAEQIAARIKPKLNVPTAAMPTAEKLLEAIAVERRSAGGYL
jgi:hypothetical protein